MIRDFRTVVVVDIEATCYSDNVFPPGERQEIIEIGVCLLDLRNGARSARQSLLVKPVTSTVSPFCTDLTGLSQEDLAGGMPLAEACGLLQAQYKTRNRVWASYGLLDLRLFQSECRLKGIAYPFSAEHINIQTLFALASPKHRSIGMAGALRVAAIPADGVAHHGADDAWNAAAVLYYCLKGATPGTASNVAPLASGKAAGLPEAEFNGEADTAGAVWQIVETAMALFSGPENAFHWLVSPQAALAGAVPALHMQNRQGRALVYGVLAGLNACHRMAQQQPAGVTAGTKAPGAFIDADLSDERLHGQAEIEALVRMALEVFADIPAAIGWFHECNSGLAGPRARLLVSPGGRQLVRQALIAIAGEQTD